MGNEITNNTDPVKDFKERVIEKIRSDIGALMPDEALQSLMEEAVKRQFFQTCKVGDSWNQREEPSWFVQEVAKKAEPWLKERVQKFVDENPQVLQEALDKFMTQERLLVLAMAKMQQHVDDRLISALNDLALRIRP